MEIRDNIVIDNTFDFQAAHDDLPDSGGIICIPNHVYHVDGLGATLTRWSRLKNFWRRLHWRATS